MARRRGRGGRPEDFARSVRLERTTVPTPSADFTEGFLGVGGLGGQPRKGKGRGKGKGIGRGAGQPKGEPVVRVPRAPRAPAPAATSLVPRGPGSDIFLPVGIAQAGAEAKKNQGKKGGTGFVRFGRRTRAT